MPQPLAMSSAGYGSARPRQCDPLDRHRVTLLDSPALQDVRQPASLPHQLGKGDLARLRGLVRFEDDGCLLRVGIEVAVEAVVRGVQGTLGAIISDLPASPTRARDQSSNTVRSLPLIPAGIRPGSAPRLQSPLSVWRSDSLPFLVRARTGHTLALGLRRDMSQCCILPLPRILTPASRLGASPCPSSSLFTADPDTGRALHLTTPSQ